MANQLYPILPRIVDANISASPGAKLEFFASGTTTPITVYTTEACDVPHPTPLVAAADGSLSPIWLNSGVAKVVVTDAADATLYTIDPVVATSASGFTATDVAFSPTVELPQTNVQDAIVAAAASAASGFAAYGIGITGNADLLANLDATNIGAGLYRFDGTTTGTYPTGVAAADTGLVEHWRQASGTAMQFLYHATTDRIFHRRMASSSWGTWRENITANQGATEGDMLYRTSTAWTRLAKGTAGQFLKMNAGATAPEWVTGAGGWALVSSSSTWTGGTQTVTGLGGYSQIMVVADQLTASLSARRWLRVGSGSILSTAIYVRAVDGVQNQFECTTTSIAARSFSLILDRFNTTDAAKPAFLSGDSSSNTPVLVKSASAMDRIQVLNESGDINGGTLYVWGKV